MPFLAGAAQFVVRGNEEKAMTSCDSASSFKCWLALVLLFWPLFGKLFNLAGRGRKPAAT